MVTLDLEGLRLDAGRFHDGVEQFVAEVKVADADGAHFAGFQSGFKCLPATVVVPQWLVQIHEVKVFKTKAFQHLVELDGRDFFTVFVGPEFGGNPNAVARDATVFHGFSNTPLVAVSVRRVDVSIARLQGSQNRVVCGFPSGNAVNAESELGHLHAIVQRQVGLVLCVHGRYV